MRAGAWELDECALMLFFDGGVRAWPPMVVSHHCAFFSFFVATCTKRVSSLISGWDGMRLIGMRAQALALAACGRAKLVLVLRGQIEKLVVPPPVP
jgi:hypothetical protein